MWTRKEIKDGAKAALGRNYWKIVLVSLLTILTVGGSGEGVSNSAVSSFTDGYRDAQLEDTQVLSSETYTPIEEFTDVIDAIESMSPIVFGTYLVVLMFFVLIFWLVALAIKILALQPLEVGISRFMLKSVDDIAKLGEISYTFDHNYKNGVKVMFFKELYVFLWSLLLVIPGIYKSYQYRMVSYILAEEPDIAYRDALQRSKELMQGHKWAAFVLDLSFIGWHMLSVVTCGLSEIFYVTPYVNLANAALYRRLTDYGVQNTDC